MNDKFDLRSKVQFEGVFWDASRPDDKFSGTLSCDGRNIELITRAEMVKPTPLAFIGGDESPVPDIVHGYTSNGECTLIGFQAMGNPGLLDFESGRGLRWHTFRVSACVVGWYLPSDTTNALTSADFTYTGIDEWLPGCGAVVAFTDDAVTLSIPKKRLTVVDCVLPNGTRVLIRIEPRFEFRIGGKSHSSRSEPVITLETPEPKSLQFFVDALHRFENFFSLCLGTSVRANSVHLIGKSEKTEQGWLIRPRRGKAEEPYLPIWVRSFGSQLATAIVAWFSTPEEFLPLESLIFGTIRQSSLFVETEFLSLAQALESFHRLTDKTTVADSAIFKSFLKLICRFIGEICGDSPLESRFLAAIRYANEPTFRTRIESLLGRINHASLSKLVGDPVTFEQTLRETRNYFTHPGIRKQKHVLTDGKGLFLFNQKLHVLLRLLILKNLGFPEEVVFDQAFQQLHRWH
jgi:ApeA N-terminal domain 1